MYSPHSSRPGRSFGLGWPFSSFVICACIVFSKRENIFTTAPRISSSTQISESGITGRNVRDDPSVAVSTTLTKSWGAISIGGMSRTVSLSSHFSGKSPNRNALVKFVPAVKECTLLSLRTRQCGFVRVRSHPGFIDRDAQVTGLSRSGQNVRVADACHPQALEFSRGLVGQDGLGRIGILHENRDLSCARSFFFRVQ